MVLKNAVKSTAMKLSTKILIGVVSVGVVGGAVALGVSLSGGDSVQESQVVMATDVESSQATDAFETMEVTEEVVETVETETATEEVAEVVEPVTEFYFYVDGVKYMLPETVEEFKSILEPLGFTFIDDSEPGYGMGYVFTDDNIVYNEDGWEMDGVGDVRCECIDDATHKSNCKITDVSFINSRIGFAPGALNGACEGDLDEVMEEYKAALEKEGYIVRPMGDAVLNVSVQGKGYHRIFFYHTDNDMRGIGSDTRFLNR